MTDDNSTTFNQFVENSLDTPLPDEVVIMSTEAFIKEISKQLTNIPFVALNTTRSVVLRPAKNQSGYTSVTLVSIGFEMEEINNIPDMMELLTGKGEIIITADSEEIKTLAQDVINRAKEYCEEAFLEIPPREGSDESILEF